MKKNWLAILMAIILISCRKEVSKTVTPALAFESHTDRLIGYTIPIKVELDQNKTGYRIPENFAGLSYETAILADNPDYLDENNKTLIQLIKNLGDGVLRIGGNTSNEIIWTGKARTSQTPAKSLTTTDIDRLTAFSKAIGWPVVFGLNLAYFNPQGAASEAVYVHKSLKNSLYALQSGNEPDMFSKTVRTSKFGYADFQNEWDTYLKAVRKADPHAPFAGPDITPFNNKWLTSFTAAENKNIKIVDGHYYATGPASLSSITYNDILVQNPKLPEYLATLYNTSAKYHLPFRISEGNSVYGGGKKGVSNVFASALWALDFMWTVAENKGQGINFHGGGEFFVYSPLGIEGGTIGPRPEYYAMLAFKYGAVGQSIVPVKLNAGRFRVEAHACVSADKSYAITLINKEIKTNFSFTVNLSKPASTVKIARLSGDGINLSTGTTFGGSIVNTDGTFATNVPEQRLTNQNSVTVEVPAGSAAVVIIK